MSIRILVCKRFFAQDRGAFKTENVILRVEAFLLPVVLILRDKEPLEKEVVILKDSF